MPLLPMGPPQGGALPPPMPPPGAAPMGAPPGLALPPPGPPPVPAAVAGMAAAQLIPGQEAQQAALTQQQQQEVLAALMGELANQPNPAAEAAQSEPSAQVTPDTGGPVSPNDQFGGM